MREEERDTLCQAHPATSADLDWIFQLQVETYTAQYAVARRTLDQWYGSNPDGFFIVTINGRKLGHLTIIPLRPNILESFVQGTIAEQNIHGDCLHTPGEKRLVRNLYVESIIIGAPEGFAPNGRSILPIKALTRLAHDFVPLISRVSEPSNLENIYALAASRRGERFMQALSFNLVKSGVERADGRGLYVAEFRSLRTTIAELYNRRLRKNAK